MRTALAAAALLLWALHDASPALYRPGEAIDADVFHSGEMLLHRIDYRATTANYHLPLSSVTAALLINHSPAGAGAAWRKASAAAAFLLLLALGCELGAPWFGLLGAALLLFVSRFPLSVQLVESWHGSWGHLQAFFTVVVLVAAGLMVRHLRAPSPARAWAVALALGAALLYRSTLVFFPPLLALLHWLTLKGKPSRADRRATAVLALVPYLFLLPWAASNWAVHHRFIPLEDGEASPIIVGGVLGAVEKEWARPPAELGIPVQGTGETIAWAVRAVLAEPGDYLLGCARRLRFIFLLNPLLFVFAGLSFWFNRRKREFQALGLLCAYWVLMHALMSMLREYFDPLWPLLAAAGAAGVLPFLKGLPPVSREREASGRLLAGALGVLMALSLFASGAAAAYAYAVTRGDAAAAARRLDAAIARHPGEAKLLFERGMRRLEDGDAAGAEPDLKEAARLSPGTELIERALSWTALDRRAATGDAAAARRLAKDLLARRTERARIPRAFLRTLCPRAREFPTLGPDCLEAALAAAEAPGAAPAEALRRLDEAERLSPGLADRRRMAGSYRRLGEHRRAQAQYARMLEQAPASASLWIERADAAGRSGEPEAALRFLAEARKRRPSPAELALIATLERGVREPAPTAEALDRLKRSATPRIDRAEAASRAGDAAAALALLGEAKGLSPSAAERERMAAVFVERAAFAFLARDRAAARGLLAEARALRPSAALLARMASLERDAGPEKTDERRSAAYLHQARGRHAAALALFDALVRERPTDAALRSDRGLSLHLNGRKAEAIAELEEALRLDPGRRAAASTLDAIRAAR